MVLSAERLTVHVGESIALEASVEDASGQPMSSATIEWTSGNADVVTVSNTGHATARAPGTARIIATSGGKSAMIDIVVTLAPVERLTVEPAELSLFTGQSVLLNVRAVDVNGSDASTRPLSVSSSNPAIARGTPAGELQAVAAGGPVRIVFTSEGVSDTVLVMVSDVPVARMSLTPSTLTLEEKESVQVTVVALDSAGARLVNRPIAVISDDPSVATATSQGIVQGLTEGITEITFAVGGKSATLSVEVVQAPIVKVELTPPDLDLYPGQTVQLTATLWDARGNVLVGRDIQWESSDSTRLLVTESGVLRARDLGEAIVVTAKAGGFQSTALVDVLIEPAGRVSLSPASPQLLVGDSLELVPTVTGVAGTVLNDRDCSWTSSDSTVARVSDTGDVTAVSLGTASIICAVEGVKGTVPVAVVPDPVASIEVDRETLELIAGDSASVEVTLRDEEGEILSDRHISYASANRGIVNATPTGTLIAAAPGGPVTVTITSEGVSTTISVTVLHVPPASVEVLPAAYTFMVGEQRHFSVTAVNENGFVVNRPASLSVTDTTVASLVGSGLVLARRPGEVQLRATVDGTTGVSNLRVEPRAVFRAVGGSGSSFYRSGTLVYAAGGGSGGGRGFNLAVIDTTTADVLTFRHWDTWAQGSIANQAMLDFLATIPNGRLVMIATADDIGAGGGLAENVRVALEQLGSTRIRDYGFRDSWSMITIIGHGEALAEAFADGWAGATSEVTWNLPE